MRNITADTPCAQDGAPNSLKPVVFSTEGIEPQHRRDYWIGNYDSFNRLELLDSSLQQFEARNEIWDLGDLAVMRNIGPAVRFERNARHIRRDSLDHWVVRLTRSGRSTHRAGDGCFAAAPHVPLVFSLGTPYAGERSAADWISLYLPRDRFPELSASLQRLQDPAADTPTRRLLGDFMLSLRRRLPQMTAAEIPMAVEATRGMLTACLQGGASEAAALPAMAQFEVLRRIVRRSIASPTLGPEKLCQLAGMSRSQLYRLFEPHGGVAHYVQQMRLQMAHALLSDPALARTSIAALAERAGFYDASAFSRAFRRGFGYAPREARAMAAGGWLGRTPGKQPGGGQAEGDFGALLRQLGAFGPDGQAGQPPHAATRPGPNI